VSGPRVSVIVPCFNLGQYLAEAVDSVLAQTFQDFEILVVDDGSTDDGTRAVLDGFARPKTRVLRAPHAGLATARNLGITSASGEYLCALDADDRLDTTFLAKAVDVLDRDPSLTFVSAWLRMFGDEEGEWTPRRCDLPQLLEEDTVLTAALVRREAVRAVGGFDTAMPVQGHEDWELWLTLVERGCRGVILPEVLFHYRRRAGSMSAGCWYGPGHLPLAQYRFDKHAAAYRTHLIDVLMYKDRETSALLRRNDDLERYISSEAEPAVEARRLELASLGARLAAIAAADTDDGRSRDTATRVRIQELETTLQYASADAAALRSSMSWRVTGPLRAVYGQWLRWRGRA
jgi:glycosyltransferase involved in cell wall biosynthesis